MAETVTFKPELGGAEAHRALAKQRLENARIDYERVLAINPAQEVLEEAKKVLDEKEREYVVFLEGLPKESQEKMPDREAH